ncbi:hypothetical protein BKA93DRAFT_751768 [Sparassis latifolia]
MYSGIKNHQETNYRYTLQINAPQHNGQGDQISSSGPAHVAYRALMTTRSSRKHLLLGTTSRFHASCTLMRTQEARVRHSLTQSPAPKKNEMPSFFMEMLKAGASSFVTPARAVFTVSMIQGLVMNSDTAVTSETGETASSAQFVHHPILHQEFVLVKKHRSTRSCQLYVESNLDGEQPARRTRKNPHRVVMWPLGGKSPTAQCLSMGTPLKGKGHPKVMSFSTGLVSVSTPWPGEFFEHVMELVISNDELEPTHGEHDVRDEWQVLRKNTSARRG